MPSITGRIVLPVYAPAAGDAASSRIGEAVFAVTGSGAPVSGANGTGAGPVFIPFYSDVTNVKILYFNAGTAAVPSWCGIQLSDPV